MGGGIELIFEVALLIRKRVTWLWSYRI